MSCLPFWGLRGPPPNLKMFNMSILSLYRCSGYNRLVNLPAAHGCWGGGRRGLEVCRIFDGGRKSEVGKLGPPDDPGNKKPPREAADQPPLPGSLNHSRTHVSAFFPPEKQGAGGLNRSTSKPNESICLVSPGAQAFSRTSPGCIRYWMTLVDK